MLQRSHVIVQYAFHVIRTETLNELLAYAATLAFARLHYFSLNSKVLEVGCWQVVRTAAILNIAKNCICLYYQTNALCLHTSHSFSFFPLAHPSPPLLPKARVLSITWIFH